MKKLLITLFTISAFFLSSCGSTKVPTDQTITPPELNLEKTDNNESSISENIESSPENIQDIEKVPAVTETKEPEIIIPETSDEITLLFGGDIMAHGINYNVSSYDKIWEDIKDVVSAADIAFANIESPIDTSRPTSSYPQFNMNEGYVQAAIDAGFDVFSLCNNHTNDWYLSGMQGTEKTMKKLSKIAEEKGSPIYYSGLKESPEADFTYNIIEEKGWKIVFFPMTEILNRPDSRSYINYSDPFSKEARQNIYNFIKEIKEKEKCDLFIYSIHTYEPEYIRETKPSQEKYYKELIDAGVDIVMANHTHLIRDRKVVVDTSTNSDKIIMYGNGNVISGQRTKPRFDLEWTELDRERDNTGDGLLYITTLKKHENGRIELLKAEPVFITTYINTANEYIIKKMDDNFIDYLNEVGRPQWAKYIERRMKVNAAKTKDLIEWQ